MFFEKVEISYYLGKHSKSVQRFSHRYQQKNATFGRTEQDELFYIFTSLLFLDKPKLLALGSL